MKSFYYQSNLNNNMIMFPCINTKNIIEKKIAIKHASFTTNWSVKIKIINLHVIKAKHIFACKWSYCSHFLEVKWLSKSMKCVKQTTRLSLFIFTNMWFGWLANWLIEGGLGYLPCLTARYQIQFPSGVRDKNSLSNAVLPDLGISPHFGDFWTFWGNIWGQWFSGD